MGENSANLVTLFGFNDDFARFDFLPLLIEAEVPLTTPVKKSLTQESFRMH
jgi:hypothetical protein